MSMRRSAVAVTLAVLSCLVPPPARATQKFGPILLSGNLQSMNIVRTPDQDTYQFIMNRNVAHIRLDYDWLQSGKFYNKYDIPFIDTSHLSVFWRGVYDSIYDTTPGFIQKEDIPGPATYGWDELRRPFWMFKFLYEVGDVWRLSQNFLEWYWNPGDWYPAKQAFLPRPWGLPFLNPLTNPIDGVFIGGVCGAS